MLHGVGQQWMLFNNRQPTTEAGACSVRTNKKDLTAGNRRHKVGVRWCAKRRGERSDGGKGERISSQEWTPAF